MTDPRDRIELPGGPHYSLEPTAPHERAVARYLRGQYIALRHFSPAEFGEDWPRMSVALLARLDLFRERLGSPVIISPAPGALGRQLGASDTSQHNIDRWGEVRAADVMLPRTDLRDRATGEAVVQIARGLFGGVGLYLDWQPHNGLHLDVRGYRRSGLPYPTEVATWSRVAGQYVALDRAWDVAA
ncbi:MAG: hypothetical protein H6981_04540 [Gammaproteobacteria bacterium]|nr:hypothetical protein [Gammaproteobacteria bacterium]